MRNWIAKLALLVLFLSTPALLLAQDVATVTGTVKDASGALIPGTTVILSNPSTGLKYTDTTNSEGSYRFTQIPAGPGYKLVFTHSGFASYAVTGVYLDVANTRTQNASLLAGSTEQVEVSAFGQGVTINTEDATIGNNFEVKVLNDLPVQDRSSGIRTLFTLQPGVTLDGSATGARTDQNNKTMDGLDINDFATGALNTTLYGGAPIDAIQEFRGTVAGFGVDSGPGGGGQFQMVTKSGTDRFHGNVNEYHRDRSTVANTWFNNNAGVPRVQLIRNQFGGAVGGPIKKDKLFFFFDYGMSRIAQGVPQQRTVPLASFLDGNVSYINNGPGCTDKSRQNTQPNCISQLTPAQVKASDPAGLGNSAALFALLAAAYPQVNDPTLGDGVNTGGYRFNAPEPDNQSTYVGRLDYNLTSKMKLFARGSVVREDSVQTAQQFPSQPVLTAPFSDRSYAWVIGWNWAISSTKVNQFIIGETVEQPSFPVTYNPQGNYPVTFSSGTTTLLSDPYKSPVNAQGRRIPLPQVTDDFTWQTGHHALAFGGTFKWINTSDYTLLDYSTAAIGLGGNLQGLTTGQRPADILNSSNADVTYDSAYTTALGRIGSVTGNFVYDSAGQVLPQGTGSRRNYKYYQTQLYVGDTWKATPHLTLSYGLNYELFSVPYEKDGLETVAQISDPNGTGMHRVGFDEYFYGSRVPQSAAGNDSYGAVPLIYYTLGGKANHGPSLYNPSYNNLAPRFAFSFNPGFDPKTVFNGSAGIVYDRTVINAVQYQQDQSSYLFLQPLSNAYGNGDDPVGSLAPFAAGGDPRLDGNPIASLVVPPTSPKPPYAPYTDANGNPIGLTNSQSFNTSIDPNLKTPYSIMVNFGMQHEFPGGFVFKTSYVGRFGRRLLASADASQLIEFVDPKSHEAMSTAIGNVTKELRAGADPLALPAEPWLENLVIPGIGKAQGYANNTQFIADALNSLLIKGDFADTIQGISTLLPPNVGMDAQFAQNGFYTNKGFSTYHGLLTTVHKNLSQGLQFDVNYTWQHSIDNTSLIANLGAAGAGLGFICDAVHVRECRGNSDFDVTHLVTGDFTYSLPFGRGRTFASNIPWGLNEAIGGWDVSGITTWRSGQAYSALSSAYVAGYANDAPAIFNGDKSAIRRSIHKDVNSDLQLFTDPTAATNAFSGPIGFQIGSRNILRGPQFFNQDLGLAKSFGIIPSKDVNLKFRADAFNVFNHPTFNSPSYNPNGGPSTYQDITAGQFGQLAYTNGGNRVLQLALRLEF